MDDSNAAWHAHIYYAPGDRVRAQAFRARLRRLKVSGKTPQLLFIGELRDHKVGPHPVPQFEVHLTAGLVPAIAGIIREATLTALVHPLTHDDLADHTRLAKYRYTNRS